MLSLPGVAQDDVSQAVMPAPITQKVASLRLPPSLVTANLGGSLDASASQLELPPLTSQLLAAYVERQQQLKNFDAFDVPATGELTSEVLTAYIAQKHNPALVAIDSAATTESGELSTAMLSRYVESGFQPTRKKVELAEDERLCLTQAIYHEARGESEKGQWAVANVIINRAFSKQYPSTICGVVFQNADKGRYRCQFTFACDGRSDMGRERKAWQRSMEIADAAFAEFQRGERPDVLPKSTLFYHTTQVAPSWSHTFKRVAAIGSHIFYSPL